MNMHLKVDIARASTLWREGKTRVEIAERFGVTDSVMKHVVRKNRDHFPHRERQLTHDDMWSDDELKQASDMWKRGDSAEIIADRFGVARNTIFGLAQRKRDWFPARQHGGRTVARRNSTPSERVEIAKRQAAAFRSTVLKPVKLNDYDAARLPHAKELSDLTKCECKWPLNDGGPFLFCAEVATGDYCRSHHARSLGRTMQVAA